MIRSSYWEQFSKKLREKLDRLRYVGHFDLKDAEDRGMRLVTGKEENSMGLKVCFYWLVDEADGVIADAKFQAFGPIGLIGAAEVLSELALRKNYDQVSRISADLIDQHVRDKKDIPAFPKECFGFLNLILSAADRAVQKCEGIPFAATYNTTPIERDFGEIPGGIPGWVDMSKEHRLAIIEEVIDKEIRPYVELDAGGVKVIDLDRQDVLIAYEGSCTSCHASTGSTLTAIQQILRARVYPALTVIPQM
jgi:NifU-like protein